MTLTIIVPVYNMAADGKLKYCLDSLIHQTIDDYEIIAVDDCSTDNSMDILKEYEQKYPNILKAIHSPQNLRQGGAKNIGIKAAKGEWLGFIDSDDWAAPDMYEKLLDKAAKTGADIVGCDYSLVSEHTFQVGKCVSNNNPEQTGVLNSEKYKKLLLSPGSMVVKIFKKSMVIENDLWFPKDIFYEDNYASPLWFLYAKHFELVKEPLYYYYQHQTSTVHHISEDRCEDRLTSMILFVEACKARGFYTEYQKEIEYVFTSLFYVTTLFSYVSGVDRIRMEFLAKLKKEILNYFPDFQKNEYYKDLIGIEEQKLVRLQQKSSALFLCYYKMLAFVRKLKSNTK